MDKLRALSHFVACAEEGSFSGAARRLGLSVPSVHKLVTALEQSLGIRLFQRSSRGLTLTASGETYLEACRPLLAELVAVDETLRRSAQRPTGTLVIAAHSQLALHVLLPALPRFHSLYPDIRIDIRVIHRLTDADAQIADVFVLHGWPEANDLVHRQLGHTRALIVGAPEYWALRGIPRHPHELDQHTCVLIRNPAGILIDLWEFGAFIANSLIFLLIGLRLVPLTHVDTRALLLAIGLVLAGRALSVYPVSLFFRSSKCAVSLREQHVLWWGGLRGALALALALALPASFPLNHEILATTFGVVVFSVVVQGLTMPWVMQKLKFYDAK